MRRSTPPEAGRTMPVRNGRIVYVGSDSGALALRATASRVIDLREATLPPGFVDAHAHVAELGQSLDRVNRTGIATEADAVERIVQRALTTQEGQSILANGWDEGAWANRYPDKRLISARVPDHPVILGSPHGFAAWANTLVLAKAGITGDSPAPTGGEIRKYVGGEPTGLVLNRAVPLLDDAVLLPSPAQRDAQAMRALHVMADAGSTGQSWGQSP